MILAKIKSKKMSRNKLIVACLVVALFILAVFAWQAFIYYVYKELGLTATQIRATPSALENMLENNVSMTCSFKDDKGDITQVFIKNGKITARIKPSEATKGISNFLYKDDVLYVWGKKTAIKASISPGDLEKIGEKQGIDFTSQLKDYKSYCKTASVSDQEFVLPQNVSFEDYSSFLQFLK